MDHDLTQVEAGVHLPWLLLRDSAGLFADKYKSTIQQYPRLNQMNIAFSLINSAIACLQGPRSVFHASAREFNPDHPLDLIHAEVQLSE